MAEKTKEGVDIAEQGGNSKKMLFIIIGVVLLLGGAGAVFFLMGGEETSAEKVEEVKPVKQKAIYHTVRDSFVVNFHKQSGNAVKYMQIKLKVMSRNQDTIDAFKFHMPAIRHELLLLFFSQNYDTLNTKEGTRALRKETLNTINTILTHKGVEEGLKAVYFTSLIMQ